MHALREGEDISGRQWRRRDTPFPLIHLPHGTQHPLYHTSRAHTTSPCICIFLSSAYLLCPLATARSHCLSPLFCTFCAPLSAPACLRFSYMYLFLLPHMLSFAWRQVFLHALSFLFWEGGGQGLFLLLPGVNKIFSLPACLFTHNTLFAFLLGRMYVRTHYSRLFASFASYIFLCLLHIYTHACNIS